MARQGRRSLLRRRGAPVGALAVLFVVLAVPARAATPSPDPPPNAVTPEPPPVTRTQPAPVRSAPVDARARAGRPSRRAGRSARSRAAPATSKPKPRRRPKAARAAKPNVVARPATTKTAAGRTTARRVPLAALVDGDELDRGLLAFGGLALLLVRAERRDRFSARAPRPEQAVARSPRSGFCSRWSFWLSLLRHGRPHHALLSSTLARALPARPSWYKPMSRSRWQFEPGWTQVNCDSRPVTEDTATEQRSCSVSYGPDDVVFEDYHRPIATPTPPTGDGA